MSKEIKHILLITPFAPPNIGGAETHLEDYYEYLRRHGFTVTVLTYQPLTSRLRGESKETRQNLTIYRYQWIGYNWFPFFEKLPPIINFLYLTPYLLIRSIFYMLGHKEDVDIIHVFGLNSAFIARILKIIFRKKVLVSMEALYNFNRKTFFGKVCFWVLKAFNRVLVGSIDSKKEILNLGVSESKITIYTHWIDNSYFKPVNKLESKKKLGWEDRFTALYLGRLIPQKGIGVFIKTAVITNKNIIFKVIGDGPEIKSVENMQQAFPNFSYLGKISNDKIAPYYCAADVLVYPALYKEDLSLVLLESMACGTPVISTNFGSGVYHLNKKVAFVIRPEPKEIKEKIEFLANNPKIHQQMSRNGVLFAHKFGPQLAKIITNVYKTA